MFWKKTHGDPYVKHDSTGKMSNLLVQIRKYITDKGEAEWVNTDVLIISRGADFKHRVGGKGHLCFNGNRETIREQNETLTRVCELLRTLLSAGKQVLFLGFGSDETWDLEGDLANHFTARAEEWYKILRARAIPVTTLVNAYAQIQNPNFTWNFR